MEVVKTYFEDLSPTQVDQFKQLETVYKNWNDKVNVISRKDFDSFYEHHVLHSLSITTKFNFTKGLHVLDFGAGGGFPGIPLAIYYPEVHFDLVDSIGKKITVINEIIKEVGIKNVTTYNQRGEDMPKAKYDAVVSRAVSSLGQLWAWSRPLLKTTSHTDETIPNGLITLKGGDLTEEIKESGLNPKQWDIYSIFPETYFKNKYILYEALNK